MILLRVGIQRLEISAFITACADDNLSLKEIISLTRAMVSTGRKLHWKTKIIVDKHCVGGLPGNRTTPIVVAIVAAAGLKIPKNIFSRYHLSGRNRGHNGNAYNSRFGCG